MQADCTFCQIVSGELPADLADEDERTVAFMDISPATLGHVLVVPRRHVSDVMSADAGDWLAVAAMARRMARWAVGAWWSPQTADPAEITEAARRLVEFGRNDPESAPPLASTAP